MSKSIGRIVGSSWVVAAALSVASCAQFKEVAKHVPPGRYEFGFTFEDEKDRAYTGTFVYEKESEDDAGAVLKRLDDDPLARRWPKQIRVRKIPEKATVAAIRSRS